MSRVGFKQVFPAGAFDKAAVPILFGHLKSALIDAGFNVLRESSEDIDVIRLGAAAGTADDDTPHWAFSVAKTDTYATLTAYPVFGADYLDPGAYARGTIVISSAWLGTPPPELTVWFAADGAAGWWWLFGASPDPNSPTGLARRFGYAGVTSRRYPADMHQGLCARYGLWGANGDWHPAYAKDETGAINTRPWTGTWSPFGEGWTNNGLRHPGSPLPKMAVPQFPNRDGNITACLLGEFNEILILTDGYASEEEALPGWIALVGNGDDQPYAVPAATFTVR